jgi:membrane protein DedA with SNARE-associated domain
LKLRPLVVVLAAVMVPAIPFLVAGPWLEPWIEQWLQQVGERPATLAAIVIGLLASDLLLPVPSSLAGTLCGQTLGFGPASAVIFVGLSIGSIVGYAAGRWGRRWRGRETAEADESNRAGSQRDDEQLVLRWWQQAGPWLLVITRPMPILAEACVLLAGWQRLSLRRFIVPTTLANGCLAIAYAALGAWSRNGQWQTRAIVISVAIPLAILALVRWSGWSHDSTNGQSIDRR